MVTHRCNRVVLRQQQHTKQKHDIKSSNHTKRQRPTSQIPHRGLEDLPSDCVSRNDRDKVAEHCRDRCSSCDGRECYTTAYNSAIDEDAEPSYEQRCIDWHLVRRKTAEVSAKGEHAIAGNCKGDALRGYEARCGCAGRVDPEDAEDYDCSFRTYELDELEVEKSVRGIVSGGTGPFTYSVKLLA
jgi:hypothetical protein